MEENLDQFFQNSVEVQREPIQEPSERPFLKTVFVAIGLVAMVLYGAVKDDEGVLRLFQEQDRLHELSASLESLRAENEVLRQDVRALREDGRSIETIAREDLGLSRPGEILFLLPK